MSRKAVVIKKLKLGALLGTAGGSGGGADEPLGSRHSLPTPTTATMLSSPTFVTERTSRSAPATMRDVPMCPTCRDDSGDHVRKLRYWTSANTWVWHCSAEPRGRDGSGTSFCGALFTEDRPRAVCRDCGGSVKLLMVGGEQQSDFYYYCSRCKLRD